ncbi:GntR family transcriptional regulator [Sphingomonas sp. Root710]|uniref:GntR family transcriptional regulator n=1 Tax=Sphingomonas sp. Root710 TaxID=1736594 RepID=UPI0006F9782D|nr:GntR family transcriptional regulator [Sphingomonas sp. Root710]
MVVLADLLKPIDRGDGRRTAVEVYESLQQSILSGQLKPGTILSQVELAKALNVSRTPVREAMRMLQEGGLLVGEPNYRSRVVGFDPRDIEALYMKRLALEAMGVAITTRRMNPELMEELRSVVGELESDAAHDNFEMWQTLHRRLHRLIVSETGDTLANELEQLELRSERYQSAYKGAHLLGWWQRGEAEHRELFAAISGGNAPYAGELAARHLARTALELLAALAPEYDTARLRNALNFAIAGAAGL